MSVAFRSPAVVFLCLFLSLLGSPHEAHAQALLHAQEGEAAPPTSPMALPQALRESTNALKKEISTLRSRTVEAAESLTGIRKDLSELTVAVASLRAFLAVRELPLSDVELLLKTYELRDTQVDAAIQAIQGEVEALGTDLTRIGTSVENLQAQVPPLQRTSAPEVWSREIEEPLENYLRTGTAAQRTVERLVEISRSRLQLLQEQKELLVGVLPQLRNLAETWRVELLKRQEKLPLREQMAEIWKTFTALPGRTQHWIVGMARSGRLAAFLKEHPGVVPGLLGFIALLLWATRRLDRIMVPRFQIWKAESEELSTRALFSLAEILFSLLFPIGLTVWVAQAIRSLGLLHSTPAILTLYALGALVALRFSRRVVKTFFGRKSSRGLLPLDEDTARFYRRNLRRLSAYVILWVSGLLIIEPLGFTPTIRQFLGYLFEVGLLAWTLGLLRKKYLEKLLPELSGPGWLRWAGAVTAARGALVLLLVFIVLTYLLGFHTLSMYVTGATAQTEGVLALWWLLGLVGRELIHYWLHSREGWLGRRYPNRALLLERLCDLSKQAYNAVLTAGALLLVLAAWGLGPALLVLVFQWLTWGIDIGPVHFSALNLILTVLVVYSGFWLSRFVSTLLQVRVFPRTGWDIGIQYTISTILQYLILVLGVLLALTVLGFPLANLALIMGALGVGIGLGLQDIVANFVSGLVLLIERPIKVGDLLVIDGQWGEIKQIKIRSTVFKTVDGSVLIIPNSELTSNKILNWTHYGRGANRISLAVGVSYDADAGKVTELLMAICMANPRVLDDPAPKVYLQTYGDSSINFTIMVHVRTPEDRLAANHELNTAIFEAFREHGIEIPFPQRELTIKNWPPALSEGKGKTE